MALQMLQAPLSFRAVKLDAGEFFRWSYPGTPNLSGILLTSDPVREVNEFRIYDVSKMPRSLLKTVSSKEFEVPIQAEWIGRSVAITAIISDDNKQWANQETPESVVVIVGGKNCIPEENKVPAWLSSLDSEAQKSLTETQYYQDWLAYTANLCTDIRRVFSDNSSFNSIVWRDKDDTKLLFHGDEEGRPPEEIFVTGLTAPEPIGLAPGKPGSMIMRGGAHVGALESFSYSFRIAAEFAGYDPKQFVGLGRYVYVISVDGGLDVDGSIKGSRTSERGEAEIAYPGGVHSRHIMGAFTLDEKLNITTYQSNPHFKQSDNKIPDEYVDVIVVCSADSSIKTYLNPANLPVIHPDVVRVKVGTPVIVSLANVHGTPFPSAWRINNLLSDFDSQSQTGASSCLIDTSKARHDQTILVEAVQYYSFLDPSADKMDPKRVKSKGICLVPRKGPTDFVAQSIKNGEHYEYKFGWAVPDSLEGITGYRVYLIKQNGTQYDRVEVLYVEGTQKHEGVLHTGTSALENIGFVVTACIGKDAETGDSKVSNPARK